RGRCRSCATSRQTSGSRRTQFMDSEKSFACRFHSYPRLRQTRSQEMPGACGQPKIMSQLSYYRIVIPGFGGNARARCDSEKVEARRKRAEGRFGQCCVSFSRRMPRVHRMNQFQAAEIYFG